MNQDCDWELICYKTPILRCNPIITIIIPSYNHDEYIVECLDSINAVNGYPVQLIVIDDCSSDNTVEICRNYKFNDSIDYKLFRKIKNSGLVDSLVRGLRLSNGLYCSIIASDDRYDSAGLVLAIEMMQSLNLDVLINQTQHLGGATSLVYDESIKLFIENNPLRRLETIWSKPPYPLLLQSCIFKTSVIKLIDPWSDMLVLDDWPFFIKLFAYSCCQNVSIKYQNDFIFSFYRIQPKGTHLNYYRQYLIVKDVYMKCVPLKYIYPGLLDISLICCLRLLSIGRFRDFGTIAVDQKMHHINFLFTIKRVVSMILMRLIRMF